VDLKRLRQKVTKAVLAGAATVPERYPRCFPGYATAETQKLVTADCDFSRVKLYFLEDVRRVWALLRAEGVGVDFAEACGHMLPLLPDVRFDEEDVAPWLRFPICYVAAGTPLWHSMKIESLFTKRDDKLKFNRNGCWMLNHHVGQASYGGGWFTYEKPYGGPRFGVFLSYAMQQGCPLLFIPPIYRDLYNGKDFEQHFRARSDVLSTYADEYKFSGSHLVEGPPGWKLLRNFQRLRHETIGAYADDLGARLARLGFTGYLSCDECEAFLTHGAMDRFSMQLNHAVLDRPMLRTMKLNRKAVTERDMLFMEDVLKTMCASEPLRVKKTVTQMERRDDRQQLDYVDIEAALAKLAEAAPASPRTAPSLPSLSLSRDLSPTLSDLSPTLSARSSSPSPSSSASTSPSSAAALRAQHRSSAGRAREELRHIIARLPRDAPPNKLFQRSFKLDLNQ